MIRRLLTVALLATLVAGCASSRPRGESGLASSKARLWCAAIDGVSSYLTVDSADKATGKILAHRTSRWERLRAEVEVGSGHFGVKVWREQLTQYVTAEDVKSWPAWSKPKRDASMERKVVRAIKQGI